MLQREREQRAAQQAAAAAAAAAVAERECRTADTRWRKIMAALLDDLTPRSRRALEKRLRDLEGAVAEGGANGSTAAGENAPE